MRLLAISDIHGRYAEFLKLLAYAGFDEEEDVLLCLGDMIDRGPDSFKVVEWFRTRNITTNGRVQALFGNHEHLFISHYTGRVPEKDYLNRFIGGQATLDSYKDATEQQIVNHISFMSSLPLCLQIEDYVFTHAGIDISKPLEEQTVANTAWDYQKIYTKDTTSYDKTIIYGHTPTIYIYEHYKDKQYEIWKKDNQICIDCTFSKSRRLLLYDVENEIEYYYSFANKSCYTKNMV